MVLAYVRFTCVCLCLLWFYVASFSFVFDYLYRCSNLLMCFVCTIDHFILLYFVFLFFFFFKQKTAYEMRISDWSSDVCSSDLPHAQPTPGAVQGPDPR